MPKESAKDLLETLKWLQQEDLQSYDSYERLFLDALFCLELSQMEDKRLPDVIIKEYFVNGLFKALKLKVVCEMPRTFNEAMQVARLKYQSLMYKLYKLEVPVPQRKYKSSKAIVKGSQAR